MDEAPPIKKTLPQANPDGSITRPKGSGDVPCFTKWPKHKSTWGSAQSPPLVAPRLTVCGKCGGEMNEGIAMQSTLVCGLPDFIGQEPGYTGQTMSAGGPGRIVSVLKCAECGHSSLLENQADSDT